MNTLTTWGALAPLWLTVSLYPVASLTAGERWDGGANGNSWTDANNWRPDGVPDNDGSANLLFTGSTRLSHTTGAAWDIYTLTFNNRAGDFVISGTDTLTIRSGITDDDAGIQTLNINIALGGAQTWTSQTGSLVIGSAAANRTLENNGHTLTLDGTGTILFNSQLSGSGGLIKNGSGTASLFYGDNTIFSSYTGTTTVNNGTLISDLGSDTGTPAIPLTGTITIGGGETTATFESRWVDQIGDGTAVHVLENGTLRVTAAYYNGQFPTGGQLAETIGSLNVSGGSLVDTISGSTSPATLVLAGDLTRDALGTTTSTIGGNLSLGGATRTISVGDSTAATDLTLSATLSNGGIEKTGAGTLLLGGTNTYTGTTALTAGTTVIDGNQSAATGAVTVSSGATLAGSGTLGGATTISGIHAPGAASNGVGTQTFNNGLTYGSGSIFAWDLTSNSTTSGFDKVTGSGALDVSNTTIFRVVLGSEVDLGTSYWDSARSWTTIFTGLTGGSFNNLMLEVVTSSGSPAQLLGNGRFSISGTTLNWSSTPEPSAAVVGVLLGAGLLRRRRM